MEDSIHEIVREAIQNYTQGTTKLGKYVEKSMYETVERIDAYLNSKFMDGDKDSLGRDKPFFNIVTAATNISVASGSSQGMLNGAGNDPSFVYGYVEWMSRGQAM